EAAFADLTRAGAAGPLDEVLAGPGAHAPAAVPPDEGTPQASRIEFSAERKRRGDRRPPGRPPSAARAGASGQAGVPPPQADRPAGEPLRLRLLGQATAHLAGRLLTAADCGYAKPRELLCLFASSPPL